MSGARGEGYIDAENQEHPVLFTNRALAEAEQVLGLPMAGYLARARSGDIGVQQIAQLLRIGLEHARRDRKEQRASYTQNDAFDLLDEFGFVAVSTVVVQALTAVLTYNREGANPQ